MANKQLNGLGYIHLPDGTDQLMFQINFQNNKQDFIQYLLPEEQEKYLKKMINNINRTMSDYYFSKGLL